MNSTNGINSTDDLANGHKNGHTNGHTNGHVNGHMDLKVEEANETRMRQERKGVTYQMLMSLCANAVVLGPAMGFGYSAVALAPLMAPKTDDLQVDAHQANWIATASALGTPLGCILCSYVLRRGRRLCLLVTSLISMAGWLIIYMSGSYEQILAGRVISGIATGLASVPATVYTAEICGPKWRSTMVTWTSVSIAVGVLLVYIFGYLFKDDWRTVALICATFPLAAIALTLIVIPESPIWLRERGRMDEAIEVLKRFRGITKDMPPSPELIAEIAQRPQRKKQNLWKHLLKRNAQVPFAIMLAYFFFQQFSGLFVVVYYAVDIIESAGITIDPYLGAVLIGSTRLAGSLLVAGISNKYGRRIPSIISGIGMTFFMGGLALYVFLQTKGHHINDSGLIPVVCVLMYIFTSTLGFLVVPFAMVGEVYPAKVKDILSGLTTCISYIISSITVKTYPDMLVAMDKHGVFLFYAVMCFAGMIFVILFLPETKGKTLREIEDMFSKKKPENSPDKEQMVALKDMSSTV